jgi:hypothetical protein
MAGSDMKIGYKQERAITALLSKGTVEQAAIASGIGTRTLYRWLKVPEFKDELRRARRDVFSQAMDRLQQGSLAAANTLLKTMVGPDTPEAVRIRAADTVLNHARKSIETEDIAARVSALERATEASNTSPAEIECSVQHTLVAKVERLESRRIELHLKPAPNDL